MMRRKTTSGRLRLELVAMGVIMGWTLAAVTPVFAQVVPVGSSTCTVCDPSSCPQCPDCSTVCDPSTCPQPTCPDCSSICDPSTCPSCTIQTTILACRHVVQNADGSIVGSHCMLQVGMAPGGGS